MFDPLPCLTSKCSVLPATFRVFSVIYSIRKCLLNSVWTAVIHSRQLVNNQREYCVALETSLYFMKYEDQRQNNRKDSLSLLTKLITEEFSYRFCFIEEFSYRFCLIFVCFLFYFKSFLSHKRLKETPSNPWNIIYYDWVAQLYGKQQIPRSKANKFHKVLTTKNKPPPNLSQHSLSRDSLAA